VEDDLICASSCIEPRISMPVVPKLVRAVTQMKVAIMSYYPQYFAVIAHNIEQHCGLGSALLPEESRITPSLGTNDLCFLTGPQRTGILEGSKIIVS